MRVPRLLIVPPPLAILRVGAPLSPCPRPGPRQLRLDRKAPGARPAHGGGRVVDRDEGEGIAPEHLPHLVDRLCRADGARGRDTDGTGVGPTLALAIVRDHGGEIAVASEPSELSSFKRLATGTSCPNRFGKALYA